MTQPKLQRIERLALLLVPAAMMLSLLAWDFAWLAGIALGGLLGVLNFHVLRRIVQRLLADGQAGQRVALGVLLSLKFGLLAASLYLVIRFVPVSPLALLAGFSAVILAIFIESFRSLWGRAEPQSE